MPTCVDVEQSLLSLLRYDARTAARLFATAMHTCLICFDNKPGTAFLQLTPCGHAFCRECVREHCNVLIGSGQEGAARLTCPTPGCATMLSVREVAMLAGEEAAARWEELLLSRTLDGMADLSYCPRCEAPVLAEAAAGRQGKGSGADAAGGGAGKKTQQRPTVPTLRLTAKPAADSAVQKAERGSVAMASPPPATGGGAAAAAPVPPPAASVLSGFGSGGGFADMFPWACPECTLHNEPDARRCSVCDTEKPGRNGKTGVAAAAAPPAPAPVPVKDCGGSAGALVEGVAGVEAADIDRAPPTSTVSELARCPCCYFAYCTLCRGPYHPGAACMSAAGKLALLQARSAGNGASGRAEADAIRKRERELIEEVRSEGVMRQIAKRCPRCRGYIEKSEGCNKMSCSCGCKFCYRCGKDITEVGYDHFGANTCNLFEQSEIDNWERAQNGALFGFRHRGDLAAAEARALGRAPPRQVRCPFCGQPVFQEGKNNDARCWACKGRFCVACKARIAKGAKHFVKGGCAQHSK